MSIPVLEFLYTLSRTLYQIDEYVYRLIYIDFIDDEFPNNSLLWNYQSMLVNYTTSTGIARNYSSKFYYRNIVRIPSSAS